MIYGIGTDIVQIKRIEETLVRTPRFAEKILGADELIEYQQRQNSISALRGLQYLSNRFAAKEAFGKAMRIGMRAPISWHTLQIMNDSNGAPMIVTSGDLALHMQQNQLQVNVSISDESDYAIAFVVIENNGKTQHV